ncbi:MAG TPA: hypothetical protein VF823_00440 [Anaerolineales bacterium]
MVHALKEAARVLSLEGCLIDMRPLSIDVPLEVASPSGWQSAGPVDMSPGVPTDLVADNAVLQVVKEGIIKRVSLDRFESAYVWDTYEAMQAYIEERWSPDVIVPPAVAERAQSLAASQPGGGPLRIRLVIQLGVYQRAPALF